MQKKSKIGVHKYRERGNGWTNGCFSCTTLAVCQYFDRYLSFIRCITRNAYDVKRFPLNAVILLFSFPFMFLSHSLTLVMCRVPNFIVFPCIWCVFFLKIFYSEPFYIELCVEIRLNATFSVHFSSFIWYPIVSCCFYASFHRIISQKQQQHWIEEKKKNQNVVRDRLWRTQ